MIEIAPQVGISEHELSFSFDRCPGPGGQNVNKVNTRVTLHFNVTSSTSLSGAQKRLIQSALASRINNDGVLKISSSKERTQLANRRSTVNRFVELMSQAFVEQKPRKATRKPVSADRKRLNAKKQRGALKSTRSSQVAEDE